MHQGFLHGPGQEGHDHVRIDDIEDLVASPREASDVIMERSSRWLSVVLQIPQVPWAHVGALEVADEDVLEVGLVLDSARWEVFQPCSRRVGQEQR